MVDATNTAAQPMEGIGGRMAICRLIYNAIHKGMIDPILKFHKQRNANDEARRIKAAFTSPHLSNAAQHVASIIADKPAAPMPVLRRLVNKTMSKSTLVLECCIQLLKDQLEKAVASNKPSRAKKSQGQREESTKEHPTEQGHSRHPKEICPQEIHPQEICSRSRRCQQRFHARQRREETKGMKSLIQWEEGQAAHQLAQLERSAVKEIGEAYSFIPNLSISTHLNACHVLGKTPTEVYFAHFMNKQFHDLTSSKSIPSAATSILGFGLKFIPVPKKSIHQTDVDKASKHFDRDFYLKVHFADDNAEEDKESGKKLQVNSTWKPGQPPYKIAQQLGQFEGAISRLLRPQQGKLNLTKFKQVFYNRFAATPTSSLPTLTRTLVQSVPIQSNISIGLSPSTSLTLRPMCKFQKAMRS